VLTLLILSPYGRYLLHRLHQRALAAFLSALCDKHSEALHDRKARLFSCLQQSPPRAPGDASLTLVEIGAGGGTNFQFYPRDTQVTCVEPCDFFDAHRRRNLEKNGSHVTLKESIQGRAEDMTVIASSSMDVVVGTMVLCSVTDPVQCLREIKRILKPGGRFIYLEHIAGEPGTRIARVQDVLSPVFWKPMVECTLNRKTHNTIRDAGFSSVEQEVFQAVELNKKPSIANYVIYPLIMRHVQGVAVK